MTKVARTLAEVQAVAARTQAVADEMGLAAFSKASDVPYTTLVHWKKIGFWPSVFTTFAKLATAAERAEAASAKAKARSS